MSLLHVETGLQDYEPETLEQIVARRHRVLDDLPVSEYLASAEGELIKYVPISEKGEHRAFTKREDGLIMDAVDRGHTARTIARWLNRSEGSICNHLRVLRYGVRL